MCTLAGLCRQVTQMLLECRDELKYSARAIVLLIGIQLVDMKALDMHLAKVGTCGCKWVVGWLFESSLLGYRNWS